MKIVITIVQFPPKWLAGTEISTYNLAVQLAKKGHEIHVITSHDDGLSYYKKEQGFYLHRVALPNIPFFGFQLFCFGIFLKIRKINPDIIQAQDLNMGILAIFIKKFLNIPYVIWGRGSDVNNLNNFTRISAKMILRNADAIIALSKNMKNKLKKVYNTEIYVVPNGIDLEKYGDVSIYREIKPGTKKILFVGSLYPVKGVQYLIIAMKLIHDKIPEARLILIGDGKEREGLETLSTQIGIQNYVQFIGKIPHEKVQTFMHEADIFVLPSLSEGFPNTILEAMACGLPIVASDVGGIPDIITNEINGYLVVAKDSADIANKILLLLGNDILRKKISGNNKELVKNYSWEKVIFELDALYKKTLNGVNR